MPLHFRIMASNTEQRKIEIIADGKKANASIKEMRAAVSLLNNQLDKLPQGTKEFVAKSKELKQVKARLSEVQKEAKSIGPAMSTGAQGMGVMARGSKLLKFAFQSAVAALLPLFAFQQLIELGRHFFGVSDQVNKLKGSIQNLTGATGAELNELTVQVQAVSNTFGKDYNEVLKAGNVLAQQMGMSHQEAFTLIEKGLLAGVDLNGDFLEQISEYAPQFKEAGIEAEDFVAQLIKAEGQGIFSDKGADVIKEFGLRIREQTKASKDALEAAFGPQFTKKLFDGINNGSITTVEALRRVSKQMDESGATASQLQTVIADVFGGPGEDAGLEYLKSLQNIGGELDSMIDVTNAVTQRKLAQLTVEKELAAAQVEMGAQLGTVTTKWGSLWTLMEMYGTKAVTGLVVGLKYLIELFENSDAAIEGLKAAFVTHFKELGSSALKYLGGVGEVLIGVLTLDTDKIKSGFSSVVQAYADHGTAVAESFKTAYEGALTPEQIAQREAKRIEEEQARQLEKQKQFASESSAAGDQARQQELLKVQQQAQKVAEARKKAKEAELKAERAIQDLRIALIEDDTERELATLQLRHERALEQLTGNEQQKEEQKRLLQEQFRIEREELEAERKEAEEEKRLADLEMSFERMDEEEELKKAKLEEHYLNAMLTEQQRDQAQLDLHKSMLQAKLALLQQAGQGETLQAQNLKNAILAINKEKNDKIIADEKKLEADKKAIQQASYDVARDFMSLYSGVIQQETDERTAAIDKRIEYLSRDEEAQERNAVTIARLEKEKEQIRRESARKQLRIQIAQIIASGIQEVASIWQGAATLGPIAGPIIGAIQTALAIGRSALAVRKAQQQANSYAGGGFTSALSINGQGKLIDDTGHAVAGVVHEKEWVSPRWMVESPKYANVIGWLESERTRKFADGGYTAPPPAVSSGQQAPDISVMQESLQNLNRNFAIYAARVDRWATLLKVNNDPRDIRESLNVLNRIDADSDIK